MGALNNQGGALKMLLSKMGGSKPTPLSPEEPGIGSPAKTPAKTPDKKKRKGAVTPLGNGTLG